MTEALNDLAQLTDAMYQAELTKLQEVAREEAQLRRDLAQLDGHRQANLNLPDAHLQGARQIGADVLWQGWVTRTRADLQMQLARVLARKGQMMKRLRHAHGKSQAAADMLRDAKMLRHKQRTASQDQARDQLMQLQIFKNQPH